MQLQRLTDLVAYSVHRAERSHRLLKDNRDASATQSSHRFPIRRELGDVNHGLRRRGIAKEDRTPGDRRIRRQNAHDCLSRD